MTTTNRLAYSSPTNFVLGLDGLANNSSRASTAISNTTTQYLDVLVSLEFFISTGTLSTSGAALYVYAYSVGFNGSFTDGISGTDSNFTLPSPTNLKLVQIVPYTGTVGGSTVFSNSFSIAAAYGGILPSEFGILVQNQTGAALAGTAGAQVNNSASFVGISITNG
jgi:hypothetical protein